jgi:O-antigen biosynthesis protein
MVMAAAGAREATTDFDRRESSHPGTVAGQRTCIVVLGMHRSGTSALTRVLSILGAALPRHLMTPAPDNETGHWESQKLVDFHDEVLSELDSTWHDWAALDVLRLTIQRREEVKTRIAEIINDEYGSAALIVVKDPRICRFAPLFLEALMDAGIMPECILVFRNPLEVVQSLARRDGMPPTEASLLWLRHVLDAEAATRGNRRAILFYDGLLKDWRGELRRVRLGTEPGRGCVWPNSPEDAAEQIDGFLNSALRHHALSDADIISDPVTSGWIADIHDALRQLRRNPARSEMLATFDRVRCEFDRAVPVIGQMQRDIRAPLEAQLNAVAQQVEDLRRQLSLASQNRWQLRMARLRRACAAFLKQNAIP